MPDSSDIQARLKALRDSYARQLPEKLVEVGALWQELSADDWAWKKVEKLHRLVHTLAGSAPTFGFTEVGQHARRAEQVLKTWQTDMRVPEKPVREQFMALLDQLLNTEFTP